MTRTRGPTVVRRATHGARPASGAGMRIGAFASATGLSRDTIRFYERRGLLAPGVAGNGYRVFTDEDVERARAIRLVSAMGFSLNEIRALLAAWDRHGLTPAQQVTVLREKARELEARIDALRQARDYLCAKARWIERGGTGPKPELGRLGRGAGCAAAPEVP